MKKMTAFINVIIYFAFQYITPVIISKFTKDPIIILVLNTIPVFAIIIFLNRKLLAESFKQLSLHKVSKQLILFVILTIVTLAIGAINVALGFDKQSVNQAVVNILVKKNIIFMFFMVCIHAPIIEELVFRSSIFEMFRYKKIPKFIGITFTIVVFAFVHYTVKEPINALLPYLAMSSIFSYSYLRRMQIADSIILHCFNNTFGFIVMILFM